MPTRKIRLLALHGKGTSARIMKAQIKPILDVLSDLVEVDYIDGGVISAPYQGKSRQCRYGLKRCSVPLTYPLIVLAGIEGMFPKESYFAWYEQPTPVALQAAHNRVAARLAGPAGSDVKQRQKGSVVIDASFGRNGFDVLTPPETPHSASLGTSTMLYRPLVFRRPSRGSFTPVIGDAGGVAHQRFGHLTTGLLTPYSYPSTAGPQTPLDAGAAGSYDGLICFSQGCAVSTGLLLELGATVKCEGMLPVRFVILICGGRPFDRRGGMERVDANEVAPIKLPSVHIHGRKDPGLDESRKLASLYDDAAQTIVELDIGHCPPRRTSDVNVVAAAIRKVISDVG